MLAILLAAALAAAPAQDTLVTKDGTRLTGTIIEESPTQGVTMKLEDGTLRRFDPDAIVRIERGNWSAAGEPRGAARRLPVRRERRPPATVNGRLDTVFLAQGGRIRGRVIEELPGEGVTIQLPDGTRRRYHPSDIARIEYADGSVSVRRGPYPPRPPPAYPPPGPPVAPPPPPQPRGFAPILPVYAALGLGGIGFGGDMGDGVHTGDVLEGQLGIWLEGGARLTPAIGLGLYLDIGVGDAGNVYRAACSVAGLDCMSTTAKLGLLLRHTWGATEPVGKWLAVGSGFAVANVSTDEDHGHEVVTYTGQRSFGSWAASTSARTRSSA